MCSEASQRLCSDEGAVARVDMPPQPHGHQLPRCFKFTSSMVSTTTLATNMTHRLHAIITSITRHRVEDTLHIDMSRTSEPCSTRALWKT